LRLAGPFAAAGFAVCVAGCAGFGAAVAAAAAGVLVLSPELPHAATPTGASAASKTPRIAHRMDMIPAPVSHSTQAPGRYWRR
jgi:hypothetical protein